MKKLTLLASLFSLPMLAEITLLLEVQPESIFAGYSLEATLNAEAPNALKGTVVNTKISCEGDFEIDLLTNTLTINFTTPNENSCKQHSLIADYSLDMHKKIISGETVNTLIQRPNTEFVVTKHPATVRKVSTVAAQ